MRNIENYIEEAKKHEVAFRLILDNWVKSKWMQEHKDLSIEEIFTKYSEGRRFGIWTISSFKEVEPNVYQFGCFDLATLSGFGTTDLYSIQNGKAVRLENIYYMRS